MQTTVPELGPEDFIQESWGDIVEADGRLTPPPRFLRVVEGYQSLQNQWAGTAEDVRRQRPPSDETLLAFEVAVSEWSILIRPAIRGARSADSREALEWLNRVSLFLRDLDDRQLEDLGQFLRAGGFTFAGGTVGELLNYLIEQRLNLVPGRAGQLALATVGVVILLEADADIAVLEDRIEFYRRQDGPAGGGSQTGRSIFRTGSGASGPTGPPRREPALPLSQPPDPSGVNVAADMR
jgi:hypothetical protein